MDFYDYKIPYSRMKAQLHQALDSIVENGDFILGEEVAHMESRLAEKIGTAHCVSVSSGSAGLMLALLAAGVKPGDRVLCTSFSFFAVAEAISFIGATPVFVDINPNTLNMDPYCLEMVLKRHFRREEPLPRALVASDLFGLPCNLRAMEEICSRYGIQLIEDMAQSFGARIGERMAGSFGRFAVTSFYPNKPLGTFGDGGAVFCHTDEDAAMLCSLRNHGAQKGTPYHLHIGIGGRLDTIQAAVVSCKLDFFDEEFESRQKLADYYNRQLGGKIKTQWVGADYTSGWAQFPVILESCAQREKLVTALREAQIPCHVPYPVPVHRQPAFCDLPRVSLVNAEDMSRRILSLPMHPYLTKKVVDYICSVVLDTVAATKIAV
ncbi:DegT/DnrJ/EryC1/StrS family aminotransferase [Oscillospiraceae bacterium MB08-C2-2]|nr:DegT/DnrJ/EryC1/StrS family aminotransferase [Oscillospiraceae bacterium MB08-C2-2]